MILYLSLTCFVKLTAMLRATPAITRGKPQL
jgi:hypothetical protein